MRQCILKLLASGDKTSEELHQAVAPHLDHAIFVMDILSMVKEETLIAYQGHHLWTITFGGKCALAERKPAPATPPYAPPEDSYSGAELKATCSRKGAYDFLACPSRIGDNLHQHSTYHLSGFEDEA